LAAAGRWRPTFVCNGRPTTGRRDGSVWVVRGGEGAIVAYPIASEWTAASFNGLAGPEWSGKSAFALEEGAIEPEKPNLLEINIALRRRFSPTSWGLAGGEGRETAAASLALQGRPPSQGVFQSGRVPGRGVGAVGKWPAVATVHSLAEAGHLSTASEPPGGWSPPVFV
jgi:hypothetical protein